MSLTGMLADDRYNATVVRNMRAVVRDVCRWGGRECGREKRNSGSRLLAPSACQEVLRFRRLLERTGTRRRAGGLD